jgi:hypothetical protein
VNFAKYVQSESTNMATLNNRVNTTQNSASRTWADSNHNFLVDCNLQNTAANTAGGDTCGQLNAPLGSLAIAATYDPAITSGFGVRPNDQEIDLGVQHAITHRLAADFQFSRHTFGNFIASYNSGRPPSDYNTYCVTTPTTSFNGLTLPNGGQQVCGFVDLNPAFFTAANFFQVQKASNFGDVSDVYTGYDANLTARLPRGGTWSGGVSLGHEVTDVCGIVSQASSSYAAVSGVLSSSSGTLGGNPPSTLYCHVQPPFQADIKTFASYPLPWFGINVSGTLQNRAGPQITANYTVVCSASSCPDQTVLNSLGRPLGLNQASAALIAPGTLYGKRVTQVDGRVGKTFKVQRFNILVSADVFNLLNSSAVLSQNNTLAGAWQSPTAILQGRLLKLGAQVRF